MCEHQAFVSQVVRPTGRLMWQLPAAVPLLVPQAFGRHDVDVHVLRPAYLRPLRPISAYWKCLVVEAFAYRSSSIIAVYIVKWMERVLRLELYVLFDGVDGAGVVDDVDDAECQLV